jgi:membrane protein DedA with SNARE-associated domain
MSLTDLSNFLVNGLIQYGAPAFGLVLLAAAVGIPLPSSLMVVAAGAFVRLGMLSTQAALAFGLAGAVLGDNLSFVMGRFAAGWALRKFARTPAWQRAERNMQQRGGLAVYLTRFLFTALAIPVNLIAGGGGYPYRKFVILSLVGEVTWLAVYGGLGYTFGSQWELVSQLLSDFGGLLLGLLILGVGLWLAIRGNLPGRSRMRYGFLRGRARLE